MSEIINKVAESGLITIDLEAYYPEGERIAFDMAPLLVEGLLLREKDFRAFIAEHDWSTYKGKHVALFCSTDAIIPRWAWMLLSAALQPFAATVVFGNAETLENVLFESFLSQLNPEDYRDQRVVIKGCSHKPVPVQAYVKLTALLLPVVKSILYGEPCSTVPVYKRPKA
jgi:hypothetical protein